MSRVGKQPIQIPSGVSVSIADDLVTVNGTKGSLSQFTMPGITIVEQDATIVVGRASDEPVLRSKHGLMRSLINNMVEGVSKGFTKQLEINGVGYRANLSGNTFRFSLGFSHEVVYTIPEGVEASIEQNVITLKSIDKQKLGHVAAEIRALKKPEPYKGKGIKYVNERIIRKSGKSGKEKA